MSGSRDPDTVIGLGLIGHGKMGRAVAQLAPQRGFEVRRVFTSQSASRGEGITPENLRDVDVCIDFTTPGAVMDNIRRVAEAGCNLVVGTTGWTDRLEAVRDIVERTSIGMVYAPNFSIGVQLFYRLARAAAAIFRRFPLYEPAIIETHHRFKRDAPSGTALELRRHIAPELGGREVSIASVRAGYVPGTHELVFDSEADTVLLRHAARSRQGFAEGALYAARWVIGKRGLFTFAEVLESGPTPS